jgi:hypothetical protein
MENKEQYKTCPHCGATINCWERCYCTVPIEEYKGLIHKMVDESQDKHFMQQIYTILDCRKEYESKV